MNRFACTLVSALALVVVAGCTAETSEPDESSTAQKTATDTKDEVPAVDTSTVETNTVISVCIPKPIPICAEGFTCTCIKGYRVCYCN